MAEITDIVSKLLERTEQGKVNWKPGHAADESTFYPAILRLSTDERPFFTVIGDNSVLIQLRDPGVVLRVLDKNGRELERVDSWIETDLILQANLKRLYNKAKNQALGVAGQLDELLKQLEASA